MQVRARRKFRLPGGEGTLTRLGRVEGLLKEFKNGRSPSRKAIAKCLVEYHDLLKSLWLWQLKKK